MGAAGGDSAGDRAVVLPEAASGSRWKCPARICGTSRSKICTSTASGSDCGKSLLLFLQLLLIGDRRAGPVAAGLARHASWPAIASSFLIDNSASMSATDVKPTRLDEAKRRAGELIDQMGSGDVAMIVSFSDARTRRAGLYRQPPRARSAAWTRSSRPIARRRWAKRCAWPPGWPIPGRAFEISETQVAEGMPATLYIFSDGKFPDVEGFSLGNLKPDVRADRRDRCRRMSASWPSARGGAKTSATSCRPLRGWKTAGRRDRSRPTSSCCATARWSMPSSVELKPHGSGGVVFDLGDMHAGVLELRTQSGGALDAGRRGLGRRRSADRGPTCCWSRPATTPWSWRWTPRASRNWPRSRSPSPTCWKRRSINKRRPPDTTRW